MSMFAHFVFTCTYIFFSTVWISTRRNTLVASMLVTGKLFFVKSLFNVFKLMHQICIKKLYTIRIHSFWDPLASRNTNYSSWSIMKYLTSDCLNAAAIGREEHLVEVIRLYHTIICLHLSFAIKGISSWQKSVCVIINYTDVLTTTSHRAWTSGPSCLPCVSVCPP